MYRLRGNTYLSEHMNHSDQRWDETNMQHFIWGESSELKYESVEGERPDILHGIFEGTTNNDPNSVYDES